MSLDNTFKASIISWIKFNKNSSVLCICDNMHIEQYLTCNNSDFITEIKTLNFSIAEEQLLLSTKVYDYILAIHLIENVSNPESILSLLYSRLSKNGKLYLGTDNRLGLRYFCGDVYPAKCSFVGLEEYKTVLSDRQKKRSYAKYEIDKFIQTAGFKKNNIKYYSVLPNLTETQLIYSEDYIPNENLAIRYVPIYNDPSRIFLREELMYESIIKNGMFHQMANSYLIECCKDDLVENKMLHVTLSMDRGEEYACQTSIYTDRVEKKALYPKGCDRILGIYNNDEYLRKHKVPVIESCIIGNTYTMPFIKAKTLLEFFQNTLLESLDKFLDAFDRYRNIVYNSSTVIDNTSKGPILERCYIDLIPLNCFWYNNELLFYDQEFYLENESANLILWRAIVITYDGDPVREAVYSMYDLMKRYGVYEHKDEYCKKSSDFLRHLRNQDELAEYNKLHLRDINSVNNNKSKLEGIMRNIENKKRNYKETCFDDLDNKEIYIFGSGKYADEFICMYRYDYHITAVLDNNELKQEEFMYEYRITSPSILREKKSDAYKVIVCVKNCDAILEQLEDYGCKNIGIYDIEYIYPGRQKYLPGNNGLNNKQSFYKPEELSNRPDKKYKIGYIAGVFDLYHLGHLNMFRRAKEYCEYLIVGVVSDKGVRENKKTEPFIPFDERIEMVRACKYVDEAVEIPFVYCKTPEAFRKYHFDVQFSGSDYENDPNWLAMRDFLRQHGSELIFFPYTEQTSSTKIKSLIEKGLL